MNFVIVSNKSKSSRSTVFSTIEFGTTSFSNISGLEIRTEKVAIRRFTSTQPSIRSLGSNIQINNTKPVFKIVY